MARESVSARSAILLVSCPDQKGLVAKITSFIWENGGNILTLDQHVDQYENQFFLRLEWDLNGFKLADAKIQEAFQPIADELRLTWELRFSDVPQRMAIFVSKQSHCLHDILARWRSGEFKVEIPLIISNHPDLEYVAESYGIPYHVFPITAKNKYPQEQKQLELLEKQNIDFIVLARYMQILTDWFVAHYPNRIINIHHSSLPAFAGAKPYHRAYERGVKLIGATGHYVTAELDEGPIIEQDIIRVNHRDSINEMIRKGKDVEKTVLARAIWYHIHHRTIVYGNKTIVFE